MEVGTVAVEDTDVDDCGGMGGGRCDGGGADADADDDADLDALDKDADLTPK